MLHIHIKPKNWAKAIIQCYKYSQGGWSLSADPIPKTMHQEFFFNFEVFIYSTTDGK